MKSHWCVHMKNGRDISFDGKAHYIDSKDGVMYFITSKYGTVLAAIPIENILWVESIEEEAMDELSNVTKSYMERE